MKKTFLRWTAGDDRSRARAVSVRMISGSRSGCDRERADYGGEVRKSLVPTRADGRRGAWNQWHLQ